MCICESFILQLHSHVPLNNCFVNFSLNLVCYSHWQPFIFFFSGLLSKAYFQQCSIFLLFLRKINPMCPALISEALEMFFYPFKWKTFVIKKNRNITRSWWKCRSFMLVFIRYNNFTWRVCASYMKFHQAKAPVWNVFTLISFPSSIMMLEIRKAM